MTTTVYTFFESPMLAMLPFYPLISFLILIIFAKRLSWLQASILSIGSITMSAISSALMVSELQEQPLQIIVVKLWSWFSGCYCF